MRDGHPRILRWYPARWRRRYGEELEALLEETYGDQSIPLRARLGLLKAGIGERARGGVARLPTRSKWVTVAVTSANRTFSTRKEEWISAAVLVGTAVGLLLAFLGLGSPPGNTSATPKRVAPPTQRTATQSYCQTQMWAMTRGSDQGSWSRALSDVSGPYSVVLFKSSSAVGTASCFTGPSFALATVAYPFNGALPPGEGIWTSPRVTGDVVTDASPGGGIDDLATHHLSLGWDSYTLVEGSLEPTVSAVNFTLSDGQQVTATTANGVFVAWWPGSEDVTTAQITSTAGTTTEPVYPWEGTFG